VPEQFFMARAFAQWQTYLMNSGKGLILSVSSEQAFRELDRCQSRSEAINGLVPRTHGRRFADLMAISHPVID